MPFSTQFIHPIEEGMSFEMKTRLRQGEGDGAADDVIIIELNIVSE